MLPIVREQAAARLFNRRDFWAPGMTRREAWKADMPTDEILKALTTNGYKISALDKLRGPIKLGLAADLIGVSDNPLEDIDAVRNLVFVMKDGLIFKRDGVMSPDRLFNGGPVRQMRPGS